MTKPKKKKRPARRQDDEIRVNFGNGQVYEVPSIAAGKRYLADCIARNEPWASSFRVQRYEGDGEWSTVK